MEHMFGAWELAEMEPANLPKDVATVFSEITKSLVGATYTPVLYVGKQVVCGMNHMIICKQVLATLHESKHLVAMTINCMGSNNSIVSIEKIF